MAGGIEYGLNVIETYAANDYHGYILHGRNYGLGTDCAGLGLLFAASCEGVGTDGYPDCHSWDIADVLKARGCWQVLSFSEAAKQRGDILVRIDPTGGTGHVVIYLGSNTICEAAYDYDGRQGDSSGREIAVRGYYSYGYSKIVRYDPPEVPTVTIDKVDNGIYRLYNPTTRQHLFTSDHNEAQVLANSGNWNYEGAPFRYGTGGRVVRLYNPFSGGHMLTTNDTETVELALAGWVLEGIAFNEGATATTRLYNEKTSDHLFTTDTTEIDTCVANGWTNEGAGFSVN